jgi:hypothetical protein
MSRFGVRKHLRVLERAGHDLTDGPDTAKHVGKDGWQLIVSSLKTLLESGEALPAPADPA